MNEVEHLKSKLKRYEKIIKVMLVKLFFDFLF